MRRPERIPIFLKLVNFDKLQERWGIDISQELRGLILTKAVREYWTENYDQRFGQMLVNLEYIPDTLTTWMDEDDNILLSQGINPAEFMFWGRNYDKDMNELPKTEWILIKDMSTDHIQAILDGNWVKDGNPYKTYFEDELKFRQ
jgi:hypothetical protein